MLVRKAKRTDRREWPGFLVVAALAAGPALAQTSGVSPGEREFLEPAVELEAGPETPALVFERVGDLPLPGPLPAAGARRVGDRIEVPVAGGVAVSDWNAGSVPRLAPLPPAADDPGGSDWALGADGETRARSRDGRFVVAERRCPRCRNGWRRIWKLRVPGGGVGAPLVTSDRIFVGTLDNRVFCVRRRNGHRLWATDVGGRISSAPVLAAEDVAPAIVVTLDRGTRLVALDPATGQRVGRFDLGDRDGRFVGPPVPTPDGGLVLARQHYAPAEASLTLLRLRAPLDADGAGI